MISQAFEKNKTKSPEKAFKYFSHKLERVASKKTLLK